MSKGGGEVQAAGQGGGRGGVGVRPGRRMRGVAWEEEEGCTVGGACGAMGGEL